MRRTEQPNTFPRCIHAASNFWFVILHGPYGPYAGLLLAFFERNVLNLPETKSRCSSQDSSQGCFLQTVLTRQSQLVSLQPMQEHRLALSSHTTHRTMLQDKPTASLVSVQFLSKASYVPRHHTWRLCKYISGSSGVTPRDHCQLRAGSAWNQLRVSAAELTLKGNTTGMKPGTSLARPRE